MTNRSDAPATRRQRHRGRSGDEPSSDSSRVSGKDDGRQAQERSDVTDRSDRSDGRDRPGVGEQTGEGVGGLGGTLIGAGIGSAAGPIGTIVGGIAGAVGGWWAGEKVGRAAEDFGDNVDRYRTHWDENAVGGLGFDDALVGYGVGHIAAHSADYAGAPFPDIEPDLRESWRHPRYDYDSLRPYVREGYRSTAGSED